MGGYLSLPATEITTDAGGDERFIYSVSGMQGWRYDMEDAHAIVLRLDDDKEQSNAFFGVYDGHSGKEVSEYAAKNLHKRLIENTEYQKQDYVSALQKTFLEIDEALTALKVQAGSTAVTALVTADNKIYVANAGDSRAVLSVKGEVKPLSYDHKPNNWSEKERIMAAGGFVRDGRVNGELALSRALGDLKYKGNGRLPPEKQVVTCDPQIIEHQITEEDEFLVLACDGIWDCLSSQKVVNIIRLQVSEGKELSEICEFICDLCINPTCGYNADSNLGCDNMTILIVGLLHGRTKVQWYEWINDRVGRNDGYETPSTISHIWSDFKIGRRVWEVPIRAKPERVIKIKTKAEPEGGSDMDAKAEPETTIEAESVGENEPDR